jgi:hypothetical protein
MKGVNPKLRVVVDIFILLIIGPIFLLPSIGTSTFLTHVNFGLKNPGFF